MNSPLLDLMILIRTMRVSVPLRLIKALICCCALCSCAVTQDSHDHLPLNNAAYLPAADINVKIPSLSQCTHPDQVNLQLDSRQPVTVIVHGCFSSAGQFRSLANVFAFHGQQTVCFNYNDRDSLTESSAQLISAIEMLSEVLRQPEITVIGHSQGGLVARRAFIEERADRLDSANANFRLTTISAPFGGIQSAAHCGSKALAWLSLGLTKPVCRMITGSKYHEIPPNSEFIKRPGLMLPAVRTHLRIVTDELDSCRQYDEHNNCIEDDFVFSLDEQSQPAIQSDTELRSIVVKSGACGNRRWRPNGTDQTDRNSAATGDYGFYTTGIRRSVGSITDASLFDPGRARPS